MNCMYILQLNNGSYYVGSTNNLKQRIRCHNSGKVRCVLKLNNGPIV